MWGLPNKKLGGDNCPILCGASALMTAYPARCAGRCRGGRRGRWGGGWRRRRRWGGGDDALRCGRSCSWLCAAIAGSGDCPAGEGRGGGGGGSGRCTRTSVLYLDLYRCGGCRRCPSTLALSALPRRRRAGSHGPGCCHCCAATCAAQRSGSGARSCCHWHALWRHAGETMHARGEKGPGAKGRGGGWRAGACLEMGSTFSREVFVSGSCAAGALHLSSNAPTQLAPLPMP